MRGIPVNRPERKNKFLLARPLAVFFYSLLFVRKLVLHFFQQTAWLIVELADLIALNFHRGCDQARLWRPDIVIKLDFGGDFERRELAFHRFFDVLQQLNCKFPHALEQH